eukprot:CAMPEP_0117424590 /NCGR_PEP_ID=MMETSP0758-20121206/4977_1 /TAXON_ID=63605 /ORGANISM="Percolomonas cosmopolitus, Strain AE-1 (ATCC 50343)" /LENGTH=159 /DNA_ID=CAMNT_0005208457 /DNA_START=355 /DNA_END=830 /DNA_ORIENTATION=-
MTEKQRRDQIYQDTWIEFYNSIQEEERRRKEEAQVAMLEEYLKHEHYIKQHDEMQIKYYLENLEQDNNQMDDDEDIHPPVRPMNQVETHHTDVICPMCCKNYLLKHSSEVFCACGFKLRTLNDNVPLKMLQANVTAFIREHSLMCPQQLFCGKENQFGV